MSQGIDSMVISFYKLFFGSMTLFLFWFFFKRETNLLPQKKKIHIFTSGISALLLTICFINAIKLSTISTAVFLFYTAPVFMIVLAIIFLKEKITKVSLFSLFISLIGIFLISGAKLDNLLSLGIVFGVMGGFFYSLVLLMGKVLSKDYSAIVLSFWTSFIAALLLIPFFSLVSLQQMLILMVYGTISAGLAMICYFEGIKYVKVQVAGILVLLDPILATFWSVFLFSEPLTIMGIAGDALILAAIIIQVLFVGSKNDSKKA